MRNGLLLLCVLTLFVSCGGTEDPYAQAWQDEASEGTRSDPLLFPDAPNRSGASSGFISVSENGRYFQYADGTPFMPIGHNDHFATELYHDTERLHRYFSHMKAHGENVYRIVLDWFPSADMAVETRVGEFNPVVVQAMDNLIGAAEEHGIYLLVALWSGFYETPLLSNWREHAYNRNHDPVHGLVEYPHEMLTDSAARAASKERIRFFVQRWGSSRNIFAWELWNEINATGSQEEQNRWIDEMGAFIRNLETALYGVHHLRTASANNAAFPQVDSGIYTSDELDFTSYHTYDAHSRVGVNVWEGPRGLSRINPVQGILFIQASAQRAVAQSVHRPVFGTEDGAIVVNPSKVSWPLSAYFRGYTPEQLDDFFTGSAWAGFLSGGAGPSLRWPCNPIYGEDAPEGYRALSTGMFKTQKAMSRVLSTVDWKRFVPLHAEAQDVVAVADEEIVPMVLKGEQEMLLLLLHTDPEFLRSEVRTSVTFRSLQDAPYQVTWYDARTGNPLQRDAGRGPAFTLPAPAFQTFVTAVVSRQ